MADLKIQKPKVLGIFCHPDDEILAGWPVFQNKEIERHLIILCDDCERKGLNRSKALREVCEQEGIKLQFVGAIDNNFYALPTRRASYVLSDACEWIKTVLTVAIECVKPDFIMTHNPVGEYGHGSHRLLFELVSQHPMASNVIFTDICTKSNHRSTSEIPRSIIEAYYHRWISIVTGLHLRMLHKLDMEFYKRTKVVYDKYGAWTWSHPPAGEASLHIINEWKQ